MFFYLLLYHVFHLWFRLLTSYVVKSLYSGLQHFNDKLIRSGEKSSVRTKKRLNLRFSAYLPDLEESDHEESPITEKDGASPPTPPTSTSVARTETEPKSSFPRAQSSQSIKAMRVTSFHRRQVSAPAEMTSTEPEQVK